MHLRAILVTCERTQEELASAHRKAPAPPLACVEIFGRPVLDTVVKRLVRSGVSPTVITSAGRSSFRRERDVEVITAQKLHDRWSAAKHALDRCRMQNTGPVLVAELGAYVEFNLAKAIQFHTATRQAITPFHDERGALGYWLVDPARFSTLPDFDFPFTEDAARSMVPYYEKGYVNRLAKAHDLRRLVVDAFLRRCLVAPRGREIEPNVWIDDDVQLHPTARLVAPVYVGRNTKVGAAAVVRHFSNVEAHCNIGEGSTVVEASVLPHTSVGRGLDLSASVVDGSELVDLRRDITVTIDDPTLIGETGSAKWRVSAYRHRSPAFGHLLRQPELEYSQYLARAAGRLFEAFKGEA